MKRLFRNYSYLAALLVAPVILSSCGEDSKEDKTVDAPLAGFTLEVNEENTMMISVTNTSIGGESYAWDFGDDSDIVTSANAEHTYTESGTYTVTLTTTNEGGSDDATQEVKVSGFGPNLVASGDMSDASAWTSAALWTADDNITEAAFVDETFMFKNATDDMDKVYQYSNHILYQKVALTADKTYKFSANISSTTGNDGTWFEVYFLHESPDSEDIINKPGSQVALKAYGEGEDCLKGAFDGDIMEIAQGCTAANAYTQSLDASGEFTLPADSLTEDGSIYLLFKAGSGWASDEEVSPFGEGMHLDNVEIKEVL
ncbi:hypothetical protein BFP72_16320 [Reichenbachiella sp. 5M10]|uniref:PKD domain-containing protein n=1 Tax=unclassified Reichenbachiella TaxID=2633076 RepID=UPI000C54E27A|nr:MULTISPECIES: PKD domain-containing protein [unclassified Reichenbachiella]PIB36852.1 hypothetical protein BFP72_16320 [Reichenbachiella sp. 5M10]RJE71423.1 hypothetical protein BGP76_04810 [Reichenbachiella sp. MSK19-1]